MYVVGKIAYDKIGVAYDKFDRVTDRGKGWIMGIWQIWSAYDKFNGKLQELRGSWGSYIWRYKLHWLKLSISGKNMDILRYKLEE